MPKVSIVMPTYNGARYIRQAIESCLNQTFTDLELIVVVDGSTDATLDILGSYSDQRIHVIKYPVNRKLPSALNTGFAETRGEYLTWTSDDNFLAPDAIRRLVEHLDLNPEVDFVYTEYPLIDSEGKEIGWYTIKPLSEIKETNICSACFLYRRKVYEKLGNYDENCYTAEDYEYWLRIYKNFRMCQMKTDYPMYYYRIHDKSLTAKYLWEVQALSVKLRKKILGITWIAYSRQMAFVHVQAAFQAYRLNKPSIVCKNSINAIIRNPLWLFNRGFSSITLRSLWSFINHIIGNGVHSKQAR